MLHREVRRTKVHPEGRHPLADKQKGQQRLLRGESQRKPRKALEPPALRLRTQAFGTAGTQGRGPVVQTSSLVATERPTAAYGRTPADRLRSAVSHLPSQQSQIVSGSNA